MANGKSLGLDGLNAEFYRFYFKDVGEHLCSAILYFLHTSSLPKILGEDLHYLNPQERFSQTK